MKLGSLLAVEQYVECADGNVDASINSLNDDLAFGYRIQSASISSGLTGIMVDVDDDERGHRHAIRISSRYSTATE